MNTNKAPFRIATLEAMKSTSVVRIGCVLARGGRIISSGINDMKKTHPATKKFTDHAKTHAEMSACFGLRPYDTAGSDAYVCRVDKLGRWVMAKPCKMCWALLKHMKIKRVFYTTNAGEWAKEKIV